MQHYMLIDLEADGCSYQEKADKSFALWKFSCLPFALQNFDAGATLEHTPTAFNRTICRPTVADGSLAMYANS